MPVKGTYLAIAGGGAILLWSGLKGKSWSAVLRNVISGKTPGSAPGVNPVSTATSSGGSNILGATATISSALSGGFGKYTYGQLEQLWDSNGGNPGASLTAAAIAMAESGGDPNATSPAGDVGLWQINKPIWGPTLATFDPNQNAKAAIQISNNGSNWSPWVTYQTGAYIRYLQLWKPQLSFYCSLAV